MSIAVVLRFEGQKSKTKGRAIYLSLRLCLYSCPSTELRAARCGLRRVSFLAHVNMCPSKGGVWWILGW
jgi:hypothetical protein